MGVDNKLILCACLLIGIIILYIFNQLKILDHKIKKVYKENEHNLKTEDLDNLMKYFIENNTAVQYKPNFNENIKLLEPFKL